MKIISNAIKENRKKHQGIIYENHHILPRSLFPLWETRESNMVLLTLREHFFCHVLLTKIYPSKQMNCALWFMSNTKHRKFSNFYVKIRNRYIESMKGKGNPMYGKKGKNHPAFGYKKSLEQRQKASERLKLNAPWKGIPLSEGHKQHLAEKCGFAIKCIETNQIFKSQKEAAIKMELPRTSINKMLNGVYTNVKGYHFVYVNPNQLKKEWPIEKKKDFIKKQGVLIRCIETNQVFNSRTEASETLNIPYNHVRFNRSQKYHFEEIKNE